MTLRRVIKGEDRGAAGAAREGMAGLFRWNGGTAAHAGVQSCLISQVMNLNLPQGCQVQLKEQLEVNRKADRATDRKERTNRQGV